MEIYVVLKIFPYDGFVDVVLVTTDAGTAYSYDGGGDGWHYEVVRRRLEQ